MKMKVVLNAKNVYCNADQLAEFAFSGWVKMMSEIEGWVAVSIKTGTKAKLVELKRKMGAKNWDEVVKTLIKCWEEHCGGQQD